MQVYLVFVVLSCWKAKVFLSEGRPFIENENKTLNRHNFNITSSLHGGQMVTTNDQSYCSRYSYVVITLWGTG